MALTSGTAIRTGVALAALLLAACGPKVESLDAPMVVGDWSRGRTYQLSVGVARVERSRVGARAAESLAAFLRRAEIFEEVVHPYTGKEPVDLVIEPRVEAAFRSGGVENFFTYFPGGLLLVPHWRGVRWKYDLTARVEVVDLRTGERVGRYEARNSHQLIHRSTTPGPFFGALIVIPGIISGARNTSPRPEYVGKIQDTALPDLWRRLGAAIVADGHTYALAEQRRLPPPRRLATRTKARPPPRAAPPASMPTVSGPTIRTGLRSEDLYSRRVAVVVGIDQYADWPALSGARADARRMAAYLREVGFSPVLEVYDRVASRRRLLALLGNELGAYVDEDSLAFIYFAGHGQTETLPGGTKRGYLIPSDSDMQDTFSTAISMEMVRHLSKRITAKHVLYAIDACYSGLALTRGISVRAPGNDYLRKVTSAPVVQILTAGSEGERAVEIGGQGLFTTYLLRAMRGEADLNGDGAVTVSEIGVYLRPQVSAASGNQQTPQFGNIDGSGDIVFLLN